MSGPGAGRRAVVIGGGISGLASAALLAEEGWEVVLLEAREDVGGRAGEWRTGGYRFETGPSWYLMPEVFDHFFRLLGTTAAAELDLQRLDPGYRVVFEPRDGAPAEVVDVAASRAENVALAERLEPGSGPVLVGYLDSARWVYETAKRYFLYTTFQDLRPLLVRDVVRGLPRLVPMLTQSLHRYVTKRFRDRRLAQILQYPAVFLGSSPYDTPGMYHLMSTLDLEGGVLYPRGGISAVVEAIRRQAEQRGVEIRTGTAAARIVTAGTAGGKPTVTGVRTASGETIPADLVVSTMDLEAAERTLLPPALRTHDADWWAKRTPGPSAVLVLLGVRGELPELLHHTLLFTADWHRNFDAVMPKHRPGPPLPDELSLYVCRPSASDDVAPEGHENLFVLVPVTADPSIGHGGVNGGGAPEVEAIADRAVDQIARWLDVPDLRDRIAVRRTIGPADFRDDLAAWQGTALGPAHTLAQSALFRAGNTSTEVDGLLFAGGSTIPGIGLPMCLISAELVVKRLHGDTSAGPLPEPLVRP
ncbi:phytoene desaturase family protein [Amnibacterium kyonggiense]|uniref:Phytoene desaturase n=1 Tax=Amnibacterium kyonggiense TaxID=595671 RepID=A0A4R7FQ35_9MICO|nr:phytoene desaturase family protein [Amnibacterium kyonggiense]TDS79880.1 phytoene desaturase [Amnibacterium kyonggiense]